MQDRSPPAAGKPRPNHETGGNHRGTNIVLPSPVSTDEMHLLAVEIIFLEFLLTLVRCRYSLAELRKARP
jgi:hypothetical protein